SAPCPRYSTVAGDQRHCESRRALEARKRQLYGRPYMRTDAINRFASSELCRSLQDGGKTPLTFYGVAFHELGHWTGHKSRLDRDLRHRFGERAYAAEELVAELCAAFLCAEFSIDGDLHHAGYIQSWIGLLKADSRAFFTAASKAQAAADYL